MKGTGGISSLGRKEKEETMPDGEAKKKKQ